MFRRLLVPTTLAVASYGVARTYTMNATMCDSFKSSENEKFFQYQKGYLDGLFAVRSSEPAKTFLRSVEVTPYSVMGNKMGTDGFKQVTSFPDSELVFVDPAGLPYVSGQRSPTKAGGASGAIYKWMKMTAFAPHVSEAIKAPGQASYAQYDDIHVIHVVGPNLKERSHSNQEALAKLTSAYRNVLVEVLKSQKSTARLLPISGGIFSGDFAPDMHHMTFKALECAYTSLSARQQAGLSKVDLKMCIFMEKEVAQFKRAQDMCAA